MNENEALVELTTLINASIISMSLPEVWKMSEIIIVFESARDAFKSQNPSNYYAFSSKFEKFFLKQPTNFLSKSINLYLLMNSASGTNIRQSKKFTE